MSIDQAAALLKVSRRTIYNRIRDGRLQTIRTLGGSQRVLVESPARARVPLAGVARIGVGGRQTRSPVYLSLSLCT